MFQNGNRLQPPRQQKNVKTQEWETIVDWLRKDGGVKFKELILDLANDKDIGKNQREFLEHYKDLLEYHQPRLARLKIIDENRGGTLPIPILNVYMPAREGDDLTDDPKT